MALHQFSLVGSLLIVGGRNISGGATSPFIEVAREEDQAYEVIAGMGNFIERVGKSQAQRKNGTVSIHMLESSPDNEYFKNFVRLDEQTNAGVTSLLFSSGTRRISVPQGWFDGVPALSYGDTGNELVWVFRGLIEDISMGDTTGVV